MKKSWLARATERINKILYSYEYKCDSRERPEYFSREGGKIGFTGLVTFVLNFLTKSMQTEINGFHAHVLKNKDASKKATKQAYAEARYKLKADAFRILYDDTAELAASGEGLAIYNGFRLFAIDGSKIALEDTYSLRSYYGVSGGEKGYATARASVLCDVLNKGLSLDAQIDKFSIGENKLAIRHFDRLETLNVKNPLLIFDRNYASKEMLQRLENTAFLFRVKRKFNKAIDLLHLGDHTKTLVIKKQTFRLRVLKFKLSTGEVETLITNLPNRIMTADDLQKIYRLRWGIETNFNTIKNVLQLENFSGTSQQVVEQDFFATLFLKNMVAFGKLDADAIVEENDNPDNKHRKVTNESQLIGILKDKLVVALLETNPRVQSKLINKIIKEAVLYTVPVRPGRSSLRKRKHGKKFNMARKSVL